MKIEVAIKKKGYGTLTMKRNKRTEIMAHEELTPLTEQILAQMGEEGATIRQRLKNYYRIRFFKNRFFFEKDLKKGV